MTAAEEPAELDLRLGSSFIAIGLASATILLGVGAANAGRWAFSPYSLLPSLLGFLLGSSIILLAKRYGRSVAAATLAAVVAVVLLLGGGRVFEPLGGWGVFGSAGVGAITYVLFSRLQGVFKLGWLVQWIVVSLLLVNVVWLVQVVTGEVRTDHPDGSPDALLDTNVDIGDVIVLILDEFASPITTPLQPSTNAKLESLRGAGYEVPDALPSAYTISSVSIPSILDGSHPLTDEDVLDETEVLRLGAISRGENRLAQTLKAAGYRFTLVESGLWMTGCGPAVDRCVRNQPLDETLGVLMNRSAFRWWYHRIWGDAFVVSGLHSMDAARRVLLESAGNQQPDLIFSHVMLPHFPYLLDETCSRDEHGRIRYEATEDALAGYQRQASCVVGWLTDLLIELDEISPVPPVVLAMGDHGTNLSGQLEKAPASWSDPEAVERLGSFAAYRLPAGCSNRSIESTPQVVDRLISCLTREEPQLSRKHFLISNIDGPAEIHEYEADRLDRGLSVAGRG